MGLVGGAKEGREERQDVLAAVRIELPWNITRDPFFFSCVKLSKNCVTC